jgi:hypothetical protein
MGNEALCRVEVDGKSAEAKVLLETSELIVRGAIKLRIPFTEIEKVDATDGVLRVHWGGREGRFSVGSQASKWAEKIRNPKSVFDKLGVKPGQRITALGALDDDFVAQLAEVGEVSRRPRNNSDLVFYAVWRRDQLDKIRPLRELLTPTGALWVIRPKAAEAVSEADVMAAGKAAGLVDVKVVRFSETHTAEKFVVPRQNRG